MSNPQHEPTMEEILASIRKIISEDAPEAPAASGGAAEGRTVEQPQNVSRKNQRASGILAGGELPFAVGGRWVKSPS